MSLTIRSSDLNESNFLMVEGKRVDKSQIIARLRGSGCWDGDTALLKNYDAKGGEINANERFFRMSQF